MPGAKKSGARSGTKGTRRSAAPVLLTIGYEGRTLDDYLDELRGAGVTLVCDVRRTPLSRKRGFSKGPLSRGCAEAGLRYEHLPELGIAAEKRRGLRTEAEYDALFAEYERKTLPRQGKAIARIVGWLREGERVALTCFERDAARCHRSRVAKAVARATRDARLSA